MLRPPSSLPVALVLVLLAACGEVENPPAQSPDAPPTADAAPTPDAGFDPASIDGLILRLDATRIDGLADGADVAIWQDASGGNRHATQSEAARHPTYVARAPGVKSAVRFDGTDGMAVAGVAGDQAPAVSVFIVTRAAAVTDDGRVVFGYVQETAPFHTWYFLHRYGETADLCIGNSCVAGANDRWTDWSIYSGLTANGDIFRNGKILKDEAGTPAIPYADGVGFYIGAERNWQSNYHGDIGEILLYGRTVTEAERQQIEAYLSAKWDIAPE